MTMNFDNSKDDNILSGQESIFEDSEVSALRNSNKQLDETKNLKDFQDNSIISKFFNSLSNALNEDEGTKDRKKLQKYADKVFKDNENFIKLLYDFGCVMIYKKDCIELQCDKFKLKGKIITESDGTILFDENSQKILYNISEIMKHSNNVDNIIDNNEAEGFYPVGNLEKKKVIYQGKEVEAFCGTLMNSLGQTKQIYYYNSKEITPDN